MDPGLADYFGTGGSRSGHCSAHGASWDEIPKEFCWSRLKIFYFCLYLAWPTSQQAQAHHTLVFSSWLCFVRLSNYLLPVIGFGRCFLKLCHMPNMSALLAGAVFPPGQVLKPMQSFVPKQPACSPVTAAEIHLRGATGKMLSSPVLSIYFTRQMD